MAANMLYLSGKGKNDPEGDSEIIRADIPTVCLEQMDLEAKAISFLVSGSQALPTEPQRQGYPPKATGVRGLLPRAMEMTLLPRYAQKAENPARELY